MEASNPAPVLKTLSTFSIAGGQQYRQNLANKALIIAI
jgi:hypothetical protein